jgi:hypothetical protein
MQVLTSDWWLLVRLFRPLVLLKLRLLAFKARLLLHPKDKRHELEQSWLNNLYPLGIDPFACEVVYKTWASGSSVRRNMFYE